MLLTLAALLNALAAPTVCEAGWCSLLEKTETCDDCCCGETSAPASDNCDEANCPLAQGGVCSGLIFMVEDAPDMLHVRDVVGSVYDLNLSIPLGFVDDLIRPPSPAC